MATKSRTRKQANSWTDILSRVIEPDEADFSPEVARAFLKWKFPLADEQRVDELSLKAQEQSLSPEERAELEDYIRVADLVTILQSKSRLSLKKASALR